MEIISDENTFEYSLAQNSNKNKSEKSDIFNYFYQDIDDLK